MSKALAIILTDVGVKLVEAGYVIWVKSGGKSYPKSTEHKKIVSLRFFTVGLSAHPGASAPCSQPLLSSSKYLKMVL